MPQALEAYRAAIVADPSNPDRTLDYTRLLMDTDHYDEAIQVVQTGMGEAAATAPLQLRLGAIEMVKGDYAAAREAFQAALTTDPELDAAYVGLAQTYATRDLTITCSSITLGCWQAAWAARRKLSSLLKTQHGCNPSLLIHSMNLASSTDRNKTGRERARHLSMLSS
jgi:tetratricopeptide (TPR) repeat protein